VHDAKNKNHKVLPLQRSIAEMMDELFAAEIQTGIKRAKAKKFIEEMKKIDDEFELVIKKLSCVQK